MTPEELLALANDPKLIDVPLRTVRAALRDAAKTLAAVQMYIASIEAISDKHGDALEAGQQSVAAGVAMIIESNNRDHT